MQNDKTSIGVECLKKDKRCACRLYVSRMTQQKICNWNPQPCPHIWWRHRYWWAQKSIQEMS